MKVCLLGNSHLAALKLGAELDELAEVRDRLVFFGSPSHGLSHLVVDGDRLRSHDPGATEVFKLTSGGLTEVRGGDYDRFILVGLFFGLADIARSFDDHRLSPGRRAAPISRRFIEAAAADALENALAIKLIERVRQISEAPIALVPTPLPSAEILTRSRLVWADAEMRAAVRDVFDRLAPEVAARNGVTLVRQPPATIDDGFTRPEYCRGSQRLVGDTAHRDKDFVHMNEAFGALALQAALAALD